MEDDTQQTDQSLQGSRSSGTWASKAWSNPRKRPRSYDPSAQLETTVDEAITRHAEKTNDLQSSKRLRVDDWPLKDSGNTTESNNHSRPAHRISPSTRQKRNSHSSKRPSRFVEGSMNDKVSQRPPSLYTRQEEAMEQYTRANMEDVDMDFDAGIEINKPSGMFRFGKAIASAFSSVNVWQGFNGVWKEKEKENQMKPERDALKAMAELKYAELKKSGYKGTQNAPTRPDSQEVPAIKYDDTNESRRSSFRDSGVDVDGYQSSSDRKDSDQFITATESLMPPLVVTAGHRSASPFSDASSGRRSSMRFHKPSMEGLKRVRSQIHLPSIRKQTEDASMPPSIVNDDAARQRLRSASSKDISKQYKLSKRVSDLENKLEAARRELEISIQEAPPVPDLPTRIGRKRFVPGALASLPSERLLTPQTHKGDGTVNEHNVQAASTADPYDPTASKYGKGETSGKHKAKGEDENAEAVKQALWNKRASDIAASNAAARQSKDSRADSKINDALEPQAANGSVSKRKASRPKVFQEFKVSGSHDSSGVHQRHPKVYAKTPHNSPLEGKNRVPPIPVNRTAFDPMKVDQAAIMTMRSIPDSRAPFGKAWDDMKNLRKTYPDATENQLQAYMTSLSTSKKVTDHTSVSHGDRPSSPFLGRPGSTSPMRTRARASRRGISPPPPSLSSAKKFHREIGGEKSDTVPELKPPRADAFDMAEPVKTYGKSPEVARASQDKPLPDPKTDDFEWDDDVF